MGSYVYSSCVIIWSWCCTLACSLACTWSKHSVGMKGGGASVTSKFSGSYFFFFLFFLFFFFLFFCCVIVSMFWSALIWSIFEVQVITTCRGMNFIAQKGLKNLITALWNIKKRKPTVLMAIFALFENEYIFLVYDQIPQMPY